MINIRYHIVSLVAVFLALAIGIFTGSTLLDRATVDYLKASRDRVDARNRRLSTENDAWRSAAEAMDRTDAELLTDRLARLVDGRLEGRTVVVLATRGIDEATVNRLATLVAAGGGDGLGVVWLDERTDLDEPDARVAITNFMEGSSGATTTTTGQGEEPDPGTAWVDRLARAFEPMSGAATTTTTTTAAPAGPAGSVEGGPPTTSVPPGPARPDAAFVQDLVAAGLVDWSDPTGVRDDPPLIPDVDVSVVVLGGEGASVRTSTTLEPIVRALVARKARVVFGEVRRPRSTEEVVTGEDVPDRGLVVDDLRADDALADGLATVDDVDRGSGTTAVLLLLAGPDGPLSGKFGEAPSADRRFPASG